MKNVCLRISICCFLASLINCRQRTEMASDTKVVPKEKEFLGEEDYFFKRQINGQDMICLATCAAAITSIEELNSIHCSEQKGISLEQFKLIRNDLLGQNSKDIFDIVLSVIEDPKVERRKPDPTLLGLYDHVLDVITSKLKASASNCAKISKDELYGAITSSFRSRLGDSLQPRAKNITVYDDHHDRRTLNEYYSPDKKYLLVAFEQFSPSSPKYVNLRTDLFLKHKEAMFNGQCAAVSIISSSEYARWLAHPKEFLDRPPVVKYEGSLTDAARKFGLAELPIVPNIVLVDRFGRMVLRQESKGQGFEPVEIYDAFLKQVVDRCKPTSTPEQKRN